jgi:hypothetical protein
LSALSLLSALAAAAGGGFGFGHGAGPVDGVLTGRAAGIDSAAGAGVSLGHWYGREEPIAKLNSESSHGAQTPGPRPAVTQVITWASPLRHMPAWEDGQL